MNKAYKYTVNEYKNTEKMINLIHNKRDVIWNYSDSVGRKWGDSEYDELAPPLWWEIQNVNQSNNCISRWFRNSTSSNLPSGDKYTLAHKWNDKTYKVIHKSIIFNSKR